MNRSYTIDLARFIAAFCVMTLHTPLPSMGHDIGAIIRISGRWAVPFFFMAAGYFLGKKITQDSKLPMQSIEKNMVKLFSVFFVSSIVYMIYSYLLTPTISFNDIALLLKGTYGHLWFVGSMIVAYIFIWYMYAIGQSKILSVIALALLVFTVYADAYDLISGKTVIYQQLPRFLSSIPFMYMGVYLSDKNIPQKSLPLWIVVFVIGFLLQYGEAFYFEKIYKYSAYQPQTLIGTIFAAVGIFNMCLLIQTNENKPAIYGQKYSLFIYLYHLIGYWVVQKIIALVGITPSDYTRLFLPVFGFGFMLAFAILLDKFLPKVFAILNGDINTAK